MRGNGVAEFYFRQYLFACQARLLFKLNRPTEVTSHQPFCPLIIHKEPAFLLSGIMLKAVSNTLRQDYQQKACFYPYMYFGYCQLLEHSSPAF